MTNKINLHLAFLLFLASQCLFTSCAQLNSFQTGKVLKKGETIIGVGSAVIIENIDEMSSTEIFVRHGINKKIDMGLKISLGLSALIDAKYQFLGNQDSKFAVAIGGGIELSPIGYRIHAPLYLSYHLGDEFAIYTSPRYIYDESLVDFVTSSDKRVSEFFGLNVGSSFRFSEAWEGLIEGSYLIGRYHEQGIQHLPPYHQLSVGVIYHFGKNKRNKK